jgi:hydroxymethylpyrimidine pyrophosphatase-like HAD family hydrolase
MQKEQEKQRQLRIQRREYIRQIRELTQKETPKTEKKEEPKKPEPKKVQPKKPEPKKEFVEIVDEELEEIVDEELEELEEVVETIESSNSDSLFEEEE